MKNFKQINEEQSVADAIKEQNARKESEKALGGRLEKHYGKINGGGLKDYTASSGNINSYLWEKHKNPSLEKPELDVKVNQLDNTINSHSTPEAMTVWSKSRHDPRALKNDQGVMHHPAFMSTSIQKNVATGQYATRNVVKDDKGIAHQHVYKIAVPKGSKGVYVPDKHNIDDRAKEFILPRGTNLKHIRTETKEDDHMHHHVHHMDLIK